MIHVTLTTQSGSRQTLELPLRVEDILQKSVPYYLAYGAASITFDTPDKELNKALEERMPESIEGGVEELNFLAYTLRCMDDQRLAALRENLPDMPCEFEDLICCASYYHRHYFDSEGNPDPNALPYKRYHDAWDSSSWQESQRQAFRNALEKQRMTGGQLFEKVLERAKENGDLARFEAISDYTLADDYENGKLCSYEFDLLPAVNFGCEGVYINCSLRGKFDDSDRKALPIGTLKTLSAELEACKVMGEVCGALLYHENRYVNENLSLFTPTEEIERTLTQKLTISPQLSMQEQPVEAMGGMQMK